jgi:hypothetical protein
VTAARYPLGLFTFVAFLAAVALMVTPSAEAGLIGTGPASGCGTASKAFAPWGDSSNYVLVPGGAFEPGQPAWSLSGGARVVAGNEPFYVRSAQDRNSLYLPNGSSALSPTVCFGLGDWHARFFVRNVGSASGSLKVDIAVKSLLGLVSVLDGGSVNGSGVWAPSPRIGLTFTNLCSLLGVKAVAFRFRTVGSGAAFQVDDVYLDPWKSF